MEGCLCPRISRYWWSSRDNQKYIHAKVTLVQGWDADFFEQAQCGSGQKLGHHAENCMEHFWLVVHLHYTDYPCLPGKFFFSLLLTTCCLIQMCSRFVCTRLCFPLILSILDHNLISSGSLHLRHDDTEFDCPSSFLWTGLSIFCKELQARYAWNFKGIRAF